uniref:Poly [ADP-ribose] polymerase n=1 Tax=Crassostrea virginica TaxID=6565 RepID=A0A8B8DSH8_CRAVI|nr:mono [ADP-ribose] polymerase PARP16-like [Crassostrea virginica]XP_022330499.1 mono [ADP-ribose] polymerase PARP16-like [Crassostrea virginica]XP_022330500.1 mono [ADP-ribose] polymerase PARP16-like [Crassostrea virginica]XP_022330502.1 mono [ADP-ribose] polymerase PARP16-like [Crassostrea virginica]
MGTSQTPDDAKKTLRKRFAEQFLATDLRWSFFVAALYSYRFDTVLKPFPPQYMKDNGEKDVKKLEKIVDRIPKLNQLGTEISSEVQELLAWVTDNKNWSLSLTELSKFDEIQVLTKDSGVSAVKPNYVFEVNYSEAANTKFQDVRKGRELLYAYHGSRLENFHSILHHGLASHMNKVGVFGEGTYLSGELSVSLHYSPMGRSWERSGLGDKLSCVAVCEMIDDPSVKCQVKDNNNRSRAGDSMAGDVPEKYYIVQNNDVIRIKYLLVYCQKSVSQRGSTSAIRSWCFRHKFLLMMIVYVFILIIVGLANSKTFRYQLKKFSLFKQR